MPQVSRDPLHHLLRWSVTYGGIVRIPLGSSEALLLSEPRFIAHVLQHNARNYDKSAYFQKLKPALGDGLITSSREKWRKQRPLVQPAVHRKHFEWFTVEMINAAEETLARWEQRCGDTVDVAGDMMDFSLKVIARCLFGRDLGGDGPVVMQSVTTMLADAERRLWTVLDLPLSIPTPWNRRVSRAVADFEQVVSRFIEERMGAATIRPPVSLTMLDALLARTGQAESGEMTLLELMDEVRTILIAGYETTGSGLAWTLLFLSRYPEARQRLEAEIDKVLGGRTPTLADLEKLTYTRMVIQESMRLYPPAWTMSRVAVADDEIGGYRIQKGTTVIVSPYIVHRNPRYWVNPEGFDPNRFHPDIVGYQEKFSYFPFSGGPRRCLGEQFAMTETLLLLSMAAQRFQLDLMPGAVVEATPMISLRPSKAMPMRVRRREASGGAVAELGLAAAE